MIVGSGRSPGEGNGYPLQYSCLENSIDGGAWQATVHGVTKLDMTEGNGQKVKKKKKRVQSIEYKGCLVSEVIMPI